MSVKKNKVLIITQPLGHNYGGLLQAYALQKTIASLGFEVETCRYKERRLRIHLVSVRNILRSIVSKSVYVPWADAIIQKNLRQFMRSNLDLSPLVRSKKSLAKYLKKLKPDTIVVGSDQVWRKKYNTDSDVYFASESLFDEDLASPRRFSYGASFGTDTWDYTTTESSVICKALRGYESISVREKSGSELIANQCGIKDVQAVLDPTFLLAEADYVSLGGGGRRTEAKKATSKGVLFVFSLDKSKIVIDTARQVSKKRNLSESYLIVRDFLENNRSLPTVGHWLGSIRDSDAVVTDSYHGVVFSMIFRTPFYVTGNVERGNSRFEHLLGVTNLTGRLLKNATDVQSMGEIDWDLVTSRLHAEREKSMQFLKEGLSP